jgi:tetratricopeptide (TPR) repeat protein
MRLAAAVLALALAAPKDANPMGFDNREALAHFRKGEKAWLAEDYATAKAELEAAHDLEPLPVLLYSLGQLERLLENCEAAVQRFEAYLATDPPEKAAEDTRMNIARCEPFIASEDEPPPPDVLEPSPPVDDEPRQPPPQKRTVDPLGITLTTVGGAVIGIGFGVFGGSFVEQREAEREYGAMDFEQRVGRARTMYWAGVGLVAVGAAVAITGVVRLALVRKRRQSGSLALIRF